MWLYLPQRALSVPKNMNRKSNDPITLVSEFINTVLLQFLNNFICLQKRQIFHLVFLSMTFPAENKTFEYWP